MHAELDEVRLRMGLRTRMAGLDDKLPDTPPQTGQLGLREVG
jgi:hypothetical protein